MSASRPLSVASLLHAAHPKSRIDRSPSLPTSRRATSSCADNHGDDDDDVIHGDDDENY